MYFHVLRMEFATDAIFREASKAKGTPPDAKTTLARDKPKEPYLMC